MSLINNPTILHAYKLYSPHKGGIQTVIQQLAEGLFAQYPAEVLVSLPDCGKGYHDRINQIDVNRAFSFGSYLSLPIAPLFPIQFWRKAAKVKIVHYHFPMPLVDLAVSLYFPRNTKLIVHWHSDIIEQKKTAKLLSPCIHRCLKRADQIIVTSPNLLNTSSWLASYKDKCTIIPLGIDVEKWNKLTAQDQEQITQLRQQYPNLILSVGRLVAYKGFNVLIEAMRQINAQLIIIGQGVEELKLRKLIVDYGLTDRVHLFKNVPNEQMKYFYHAAKIFAFPSITANEAFGIVQLEAMACGKPIINTNLNTGVPWVARDQQEAITVPAGEVKPLIKAIELLLQQPILMQKLAENAYQRVNEAFTLSKLLDNVSKIYEEVLANNFSSPMLGPKI